MANKEFQLNATAASLLGFLHEGEMTGWDLVALADRRIGNFWNLTKSQVYRELQVLADNGLVSTGKRGKREKRVFTLTQAGRQAFVEWLQRMPAQEIIRYPLLLSISFAEYTSPEVLGVFIQEHYNIHIARLEKYKEEFRTAESQDSTDMGQLLTFSFGIQYEEMVLRWMDEALSRLGVRH